MSVSNLGRMLKLKTLGLIRIERSLLRKADIQILGIEYCLLKGRFTPRSSRWGNIW
jgi:hypothetical protein